MKGSSYGILGDIIVGLIGSFLGGHMLSFFIKGAIGFWGSILVAFIGASLLIFLVRAIRGRQVAFRPDGNRVDGENRHDPTFAISRSRRQSHIVRCCLSSLEACRTASGRR